MSAELFSPHDFTVLTRPGIASAQLISPKNSPQAQVTITHVTVEPGAKQPRHLHEHAEQVWMAISGSGHLLLEGEQRRAFSAGDVARFPPGTVHGFENTGETPFEYMSATVPPVDHTSAYEETK